MHRRGLRPWRTPLIVNSRPCRECPDLSGGHMEAIELRHHTIKRLLRPLVRRTLSPRMLQFVRFQWWRLSSYFPRLVTSWFVKRTPQIRSSGAALTVAHLAKRLQRVNVWAP